MTKNKNVQTTISKRTYNKLIKIAEKYDLTIKEVLKEAIDLWINLKSGINPNDPIFNLEPVSYGSKDVSEKIDSVLYGDDN